MFNLATRVSVNFSHVPTDFLFTIKIFSFSIYFSVAVSTAFSSIRLLLFCSLLLLWEISCLSRLLLATSSFLPHLMTTQIFLTTSCCFLQVCFFPPNFKFLQQYTHTSLHHQCVTLLLLVLILSLSWMA